MHIVCTLFIVGLTCHGALIFFFTTAFIGYYDPREVTEVF